MRADNSLNFYTTSGLGNDVTKPSFALDATKIQVKTPGANTLTEVPTTNLSYLSDLDENIKAAFADIRTHFTGSAATDTSALKVTADAKIGGNLAVGGNATFDQQVSIVGNLNIAQNLITKGNGFFGGNLEVAGSQIVNMNLYVKGDTFLNGRFFVTQDASFHANIATYGQIAAASHMITALDLSAGRNLFVSGTSQMNSKATVTAGGIEVTGLTQLNNELAVIGNSVLTGKIEVNGASTLKSTLAVDGASTMNSKATITAGGIEVTGLTKLNSELSLAGNAVVTGKMEVNAASSLKSTLAVDGASTFNAKATVTAGGLEVTGNANLNNELAVTGNASVTGKLAVTSTTALSDRLTISANGMDVTGNSDIRADSSMNFYSAGVAKFTVGPVNMTVVNGASNGTNTDAMAIVPTSKLSYIYDLDENVKAAFADIRSHFTGAADTKTTALEVSQDAKIGGNLQVGGNAQFDQQVAISGNLNIAQNLITKGNGFFGGNLEVAGSQIIHMNLYVKGDTFLSGRLFVTQDASFHANVAVYGQIASASHIITALDLSAGRNMYVSGTSQMNSKATITAGGLEVTGDVSMHDNFSLDGNASITKNLSVTGNSSVSGWAGVSGTFDVSGATALRSTLDVTGKANFLADMSANGNVVMSASKTFINGDLKLSDGKVSSILGNLTIGPDDISNWVHIPSNLIVDGSINFAGTITQNNVNISVSDELDISSNGPIILKAMQNSGTIYDIASFYNSAQAAPVFIVGKNNTVAINKATADANVTFDVLGNAQFSGDMSLNSTLHVAQKLTANANVELTAGDFKVTVGHSEVQDLKVNTTSVFTGLATFNNGIKLGETFIDQW